MKLKNTIAISFLCTLATGILHASAAENTIGVPVAASATVTYTGTAVTSHTLVAKTGLDSHSDNTIAVGTVQFSGPAAEYVALHLVGLEAPASTGIIGVAITSDDPTAAVMSARMANDPSEGYVNSYTEGSSTWSKYKTNGANSITYSVKGQPYGGAASNKDALMGNYPLTVEALLLSK